MLDFHHVGIVVENIKESIDIYKDLGYNLEKDTIVDMIQNNKIAFLSLLDKNTRIELIEPIDNNSTVRNHRGYHHICYEVKDIDEYINNFDRSLGLIFTEKIKAPALENRNIVFIYLKNGNIIEILESKEE